MVDQEIDSTLLTYLLRVEIRRHPETQAIRFIQKFVNGPILVGGICLNVLVLTVLRRRTFNGSPSRLLLSLMAAVDLAILVSALLPKVATDNLALPAVRAYHRFFEITRIGCKLAQYKNYVLIHLGPWTLALLSVHRFACIVFPSRFAAWFTARRLLGMWTILLVICCAVNVVYLLEADPRAMSKHYRPEFVRALRAELKSSDCGFADNEFAANLAYMYTVFQYFLPTVVLIACNLGIMISLCRGNPALRRYLGNEDDNNRVRQEKSAGLLVFLVTVVYLTLMTPGTLLLLLQNHITAGEPPYSNIRVTLLLEVINSMYFLNSAVNFLLYMCSANFRAEVRKMICSRCRYGGEQQDEGGEELTAEATRTEIVAASGIENEQRNGERNGDMAKCQ